MSSHTICREYGMNLVVNNIEVEVRAGTIADVPLLLSFIRSMAAFEKLTVSATLRRSF